MGILGGMFFRIWVGDGVTDEGGLGIMRSR